MAENRDASIGEVVDVGKTGLEAVETGGASLVADPMATARLAKEAPVVVKTVAKKGLMAWAGCCVLELVAVVFVGLFIVNLFAPGTAADKEAANSASSTTKAGNLKVTASNLKSDTFLVTSYHPCIKGAPGYSSCDIKMEGGSGTSSGWTIVYAPDSPLGYIVRLKSGGKTYKYEYAVAVSQNSPLVPLQHGSKFNKAVVFDGIPFLPLDHFATCAKSPSIDILADQKKVNALVNKWKKKGLVVRQDVNNGCGSATEIKGSIADIKALLSE